MYLPPDYSDPDYRLSSVMLSSVATLESASDFGRRMLQRSAMGVGRTRGSRFLYKYIGFEASVDLEIKKARDLLVLGRLYMSSLSSLNDEDEGRVELSFDEDPISFRKWAEDRAAKHVARLPKYGRRKIREQLVRNVVESRRKDPQLLQRTYASLISEYGVHCFSVDPRSHHLWSHYARGGRGLCLQFDRIRCPGVLTLTHPVQYSDAPPKIVWPVDRDRILESLLTKATSNRWEAEVRYISQVVKDRCLDFDARALTGVILGRRFSETPSAVAVLRKLLLERDAAGLLPPTIYRVDSPPGSYKKKIIKDSGFIGANV